MEYDRQTQFYPDIKEETIKTRKFLAILLTLAMCLGMLPGMAWADEIKYKPDSSGKYVESTEEESITLEGVQKVAAAKVAKI